MSKFELAVVEARDALKEAQNTANQRIEIITKQGYGSTDRIS